MTPDLPTLAAVESQAIRAALTLTAGHQARAAHLLGVTPWALRRRMRKYGITAPRVVVVVEGLDA